MQTAKLIIAEINTWVWLNDLEKKYGKSLTLDLIPSKEWDELADLGFTAIWLMGIWMRSPRGKKISQENIDLYDDYNRSLPDWKMEDLPGSPYCVKEYSVDPRFGGNRSLEVARKELASRKMKLILDFVPNHVALDHKWVIENPEFLIHADEVNQIRNPHDYFQTADGTFANARDPFFPPWQDCAQLNAFSMAYREAAVGELLKIGGMCDGVRCDMAMLMLNWVFSYTWQNRAGTPPEIDFWKNILPKVKKQYPGMVFIAEAYWGLEWDLQQEGFDYCYDKRLYDRLIHETAETIRQHLEADFNFQSRLIRFIENHDEQRVAGLLSLPRLKAASIIMTTLPGACMMYEGQWEGRKQSNHVLLGRRQNEKPNLEILSFYKKLIPLAGKISSMGEWQLLSVNGWADNQSCRNLIAYSWRNGKKKYLIAVNFSDVPSQARISMPWISDTHETIKITDLFSRESFYRNNVEIRNEGLFVDLPAWGFHCFSVEE